MPPNLTHITEEIRLAGRALGEFSLGLFNPTVRLGVTGLSGAGKTVFITALVHQLLHGGRLPVFEALASGRIARARLEPQPDDADLLHHEERFSDYSLHHLLTRTARVESDLVDQLFNSSEMRLARTLLLLANYGVSASPGPMSITVNHEMLAEMIGTTRSRVSVFMNKFRKLGLIKYNGKLEIQKALLNYVLHDKPQIK